MWHNYRGFRIEKVFRHGYNYYKIENEPELYGRLKDAKRIIDSRFDNKEDKAVRVQVYKWTNRSITWILQVEKTVMKLEETEHYYYTTEVDGRTFEYPKDSLWEGVKYDIRVM